MSEQHPGDETEAEQTSERPAVPAAPAESTDPAASTDPAEAAGDTGATPAVTGGSRRRRRSRIPGCLAVLAALAVVAGGLYVVVDQGKDFLDGLISSAPDYPGPGEGKVLFEVASGDSATVICRNLKDKKVVESVDACIEAANGNSKANAIQAGYYQLKREMASADAIDVLVNPSNLVTTTVTVPEGLRVSEVVALLADKTEFGATAFRKALGQPDALGLPAYAEGNPEGYLFPATYAFGPKDTPVDMLTAMVTRWKQAADSVGLEKAADALGYTPAELMVVSSLVQSEARGSDMPKVARVIYNRLTGTETNGLLQIDATVNYATGNKLGAVPTTEDLQVASPYNTYQNPGLPPTPIEAPGEDAMRAATHPADGDWYYYVTVNLATGETKFASTYDEFLTYKAELQQYCATESAGAC